MAYISNLSHYELRKFAFKKKVYYLIDRLYLTSFEIDFKQFFISLWNFH